MSNSIPETSGYYGEHEEREALRHEQPEEPMLDPEDMCIECGRESLGMCGCCGMPLCSMHVETQAGFCSNFGDHEVNDEEKTGCKIGDDFFEFENPYEKANEEVEQ